MKKTIFYFYLSTVSLFLAACGGGGGNETVNQGQQNAVQAKILLSDIALPNIKSWSLPAEGELNGYIQLGNRKEELVTENGLVTGAIENVQLGETLLTITFEFNSTEFQNTFILALASKQMDVEQGTNNIEIQAGAYLIAELDDDGDGISNLDELQWPTAPTNPSLYTELAPIFENPAEVDFLEYSEGVVTQISAKDPNKKVISYQLGNGGDNALFSIDANGRLSIIGKSPAHDGSTNQFELTVIATDEGNSSSSQNITITLIDDEGKTPPTIETIAPQVIGEANALTLNISASDADNDSLQLTVQNLPNFANFTDNGDGSATFVFTPQLNSAGIYSVTVNAFDGELSASQTFELSVTNSNFLNLSSTLAIDRKQLPATGTLSVTATLTNGPSTDINLPMILTASTAAVSINNLLAGSYDLMISVYFKLESGEKYLISRSQNQRIEVVDGNTNFNIDSSAFNFSMDDDNDGVTNLDEIIAGSPAGNANCRLGTSLLDRCTLG